MVGGVEDLPPHVLVVRVADKEGLGGERGGTGLRGHVARVKNQTPDFSKTIGALKTYSVWMNAIATTGPQTTPLAPRHFHLPQDPLKKKNVKKSLVIVQWRIAPSNFQLPTK